MSRNQRVLAGSIAFLMLIGLAAFMILCAAAALLGVLNGEKGIGRVLLRLLERIDALKSILRPLVPISGACVGALNAFSRKKPLLWLGSAIVLVGIAASLVAYVNIGDSDTAYQLFYYSDPPLNYDQLQAASMALFGSTIAWFSTVLATQLGFSGLIKRARGQRGPASDG